MTTTKTSVAAALMSGALIGVSADASMVAYSDPVSFSSGLAETHVESFESMGSGAVASLSFGGAMAASATTVGAFENTVLDNSDGFGAVSLGPGKFWKLRAGTTTIDFGSTWDAFGFWYSDLEGATLMVSVPDLGLTTALDDDNSGVNHFFGVRSDAPFSSVTIAWSGNSGDGVGLDDMVVGRAVPAPGSGALATLSVVCVAGVRTRPRHRRRVAA